MVMLLEWGEVGNRQSGLVGERWWSPLRLSGLLRGTLVVLCLCGPANATVSGNQSW